MFKKEGLKDPSDAELYNNDKNDDNNDNDNNN